MGWTQLQQRFPWPDVRPDIRPHVHGWVVHEVEALGNKRFWRYVR